MSNNTATMSRKKLGTKITLLLCGCDSNALGSEMIPILAVMALAFPGENTNLLVALPPLFIIPASLFVIRLSYYISRKTILTIGQILFIIGGLGGAIAPSFEFLIATRVFFGLGCGLVYPVVPTLISQFYKSQERYNMMGAANATGSIVAMSFSVISGSLALFGWRFPFLINLFFLGVLIMQLVFLPKVPPEREMKFRKEEDKLSREEKKIGHSAWIWIIIMFVSMTLSMVYLFKIAIFIAENNFGDSVMAGIASSVTTGTALMMSIIFPLAFRLLKRWTILIPMGAVALSYILFAVSTSMAIVFVGASIFGIYLGFLIPYMQTSISDTVHPIRRTRALSLLATAMFAGQAAASIYISTMEAILGTSTVLLFEVMAISFAVLLLIVLVYLIVTRKSWDYRYGDVTE